MMSSENSCTRPAGLLRQGSMALAGLLAAAISSHAQVSVLDDFEAGSNQNLFLGYSYFYADAADGGTSKVNSSAPGATATELLVDPLKSFDAGYNGSTKSLLLDFEYGANKPVSCGGTCSYGQMVGFGTQFVPGTDDASGAPTTKTIDLTGATALTFYAKASVAMKLRVEFTTTSVTDFAYHRGEVTVSTEWAKQTVMLTAGLGGINQPSWTTTPVTFDPTKLQKLQISVSADDNATLTAGKLWLDSIAVVGYSWVPPNACLACTSSTAATGAVLGDLEPVAAPPRAGNQNATGGFWFVYNDIGERAITDPSLASEIFEGVTLTDPLKPIFKVSAGKGAAASNGAYIKFTLGPSYEEASNTIMPFVGIGTKTSDDLETMYMNASTSTGIAFDYNTDADSKFKFIRLEVKTNQTDLGTNKGVVHSVLLPATGGAWKTANVAWEKFSLPDWDEVPDKTAPVKKSGILKFQWAVQDAPGTTGGFAIDNVKMPGMPAIEPLSIRGSGRSARGGIKLHQMAGRLDVAFEMPAGASQVEISLVDMKGQIVQRGTVEGKGSLSVPLMVNDLRSGLYSVQVRNGKDVRAVPVTLLK